MTITLVAVLMFVAAIGSGRLLNAHRTIPSSVPPTRGDLAQDWVAPDPDPDESELPEPLPLARTTKVIASLQGGYLLSDRHSGGSPDRTAALLATMAGPGVCTPHDG